MRAWPSSVTQTGRREKQASAQCVPLNKKDVKVFEILSKNTYKPPPVLCHIKLLTQTIENNGKPDYFGDW